MIAYRYRNLAAPLALILLASQASATDRKPLVLNGGTPIEIPAGDTLVIPDGGRVGPAGVPSTGLLTVTGENPNQSVVAVNSYTVMQPWANYITPDIQFNAQGGFESFPDDKWHIGFLVNGGKPASTINTTGNYILNMAKYGGSGGGTSSTFITAHQSVVQPAFSASGVNNTGNFTGSNPECIIDKDLTPTSCVAEEANIETHAAPTNVRQGIRIADRSSIGTLGITTDSGLGILRQPNGLGFRNGILFGDEGQANTFPIVTLGHIISTAPSSVKLTSAIDFSQLSGGFESGVISTPANVRQLCAGAPWTCGGGAIVSATGANGGQLVFDNNAISFNWSTIAFSVSNVGNATLQGSLALGSGLQLGKVVASALPACSATNEGQLFAVTNSNSAAFNAAVTGGGTNHVLAYCNGTGWRVH